ncbi:hypothetical protein D3C73_1088780 [compost metagenome]
MLDCTLVADLHKPFLFNDYSRQLSALQHFFEYGLGNLAADGTARDEADHFAQSLRGNLHLGQLKAVAVQISEQIAHHPVGYRFGILRISQTAFKEISQRLGGGQYARIVGSKAEFFAVTGLTCIR